MLSHFELTWDEIMYVINAVKQSVLSHMVNKECFESQIERFVSQGDYSLRRPPKLIIQQIFIKQI